MLCGTVDVHLVSLGAYLSNFKVWIDTAIISPSLYFASIVWWHRKHITRKSFAAKLNKVQMQACWSASGVIGTIRITIFTEASAFATALRLKEIHEGSKVDHYTILGKSKL